MSFDIKKFTDFGTIGDAFKNPGAGISSTSFQKPSADDLTTLFTDAKTAFMEFVQTLISGAKASTLGASFMENAPQIVGLAVFILGMVLYIQIQLGNEQAASSHSDSKRASSITDSIDLEKPSTKITKKVTLELFTPQATSRSSPDAEPPNPHDPPGLATRSMKGGTVSASTMGNNIEDAIITAVSAVIPNAPSAQTREKLEQKSASCKSTDSFCKHNHADLEKACGDIKSQGTCSEKCCCGWVKFSNEGNDKGGSAGKSVLHSVGISPDGKCVAGDVKGPELTFDRDIDYYYYMGECMKGVCKPKGT